jgi:hypothetical protein
VVFIDPDGTMPDWMYVVVSRDTGVWYQQQFGGTATRQGRVQGYLVPVVGPHARQLLDDLFVRDLRGTGLWGGSRKPDDALIERVRDIVQGIQCANSEPDVWELQELRLDDSRLAEIDEAWLPVVSPDGPGVLLWPNSD